jgi:hypothetical protein
VGDPETSSDLTDREKVALLFADRIYLDWNSIDAAFMERLQSVFTLSEIVELGHMAMWNCFFHQLNNLFDIDPNEAGVEEYLAWRDGFVPMHVQ